MVDSSNLKNSQRESLVVRRLPNVGEIVRLVAVPGLRTVFLGSADLEHDDIEIEAGALALVIDLMKNSEDDGYYPVVHCESGIGWVFEDEWECIIPTTSSQ